MARPRTTDPQKFKHKDGGWRVSIEGRQYRLGPDEEAAETRRKQLVGRWLLRTADPAAPAKVDYFSERSAKLVHTVAGVCAEYQTRGLRPNIDWRQKARIGRACDALVAWCGRIPVAEFGGPELKRFRQHLLGMKGRGDQRVSRVYVNHLTGCIRTCWRWAASERLVPADRAGEVAAVRSLREGEGGRETPRVLPPADGAVDATLAHLGPVVKAMVQLQRLTGMRSGEVCQMKRGEISTSPTEILRPPNSAPVAAATVDGVLVWCYAPQRHKTRLKGKVRLIALGPAEQKVLSPLLDGLGPGDFVFRPRGHNGSAKAFGKIIGPCYDTQSYDRAVRDGCERAGVEPWSPGRLRHARATELFGDDPQDAAAALGHERPDMTARYAAANFARAARVAARRG